jgi:hypothetical protein
LTAIALIPLGLYFAASILWLATSDHATAAAWLASPVGALLVILFMLVESFRSTKRYRVVTPHRRVGPLEQFC